MPLILCSFFFFFRFLRGSPRVLSEARSGRSGALAPRHGLDAQSDALPMLIGQP